MPSGPNESRRRISHPLLDSPQSPNPKRAAKDSKETSANATAVSTETPNLLNALEMAARPPAPGKETIDGPVAVSRSYASSIEAMSAHVEAAQGAESIPSRAQTRKKQNSSKKRNGSGGGGSRASTPTSLNSSGKKHPFNLMRRLIILVLSSFLVSEAFLLLLVFRFKDSVVSGEVLVLSCTARTGDCSGWNLISQGEDETIDQAKEQSPEENFVGSDVELSQKREFQGVSLINEANNFEMVMIDDSSWDSPQPGEEAPAEPEGSAVEDIRAETDVDSNNLASLESTTKEAFGILRRSNIELDEKSTQKRVEMMCGNVWLVSSQMVLSGYPNIGPLPSNSGGSNSSNILSEIEADPWKSLALDSQYCLGGAGIAFLSKNNLDIERLVVSSKVFDRLTYIKPYDLNVRAGLGTSLLIQGVFHASNANGGDNTQRSLLTLAVYHLKVASSLCYGARGLTSASSTMMEDDETLNANAAILHNLALAQIAIGDVEDSVAILVRSASLRRQFYTTVKLFWNAPHEMLRLVEEKALLLAAKSKKHGKGKRKRRFPFFR